MLPLPDILIWLVLGLAVLCCLARRTRPGMLLLGLMYRIFSSNQLK